MLNEVTDNIALLKLILNFCSHGTPIITLWQWAKIIHKQIANEIILVRPQNSYYNIVNFMYIIFEYST